LEEFGKFRASVLLLAILVGCTAAPAPSQPVAKGEPTIGPAALVDQSECRARIEAAELAKPETIAPVDACRFTSSGVAAAREVLAAGGSREQLWAAVWVYGSTSGEPEPLRPMLAYDDPSLRAMAGAAMARAGERDGLTALRQALDADGFLLGATTPLPIARFAATSLARLVTAPGTPASTVSAEGDALFIADWRTWFEQHGPALVYDAAAGEWKLP